MLECKGCSDWKVMGRFTTKSTFGKFGEIQSETNLKHGSSGIDGWSECLGEHAATIQDLVSDAQFNAVCGGGKPYPGTEFLKCMLSTQRHESKLYASDNVIKKAASLVGLKRSDHVKQYPLIEPLLDTLHQLDDEFYTNCNRVTNSDELENLVVIMPYAKKAFESCYQVIGLDAAHLDEVEISRKPLQLLKKKNIVAISGRTAANKMIIFGYAITRGETIAAYDLLIQACISAGMRINSPTVAVVTDRGPAVIAAVKRRLSECYHIWCAEHLRRNLVQMKFNKNEIEFFKKARNSLPSSRHVEVMTKMETECNRLYTYLLSIGPENWALCFAEERGIMLHGMMTDNLVEQIFAFIKPERSLSTFFCIQEVTLKALRLFIDERDSTWFHHHKLTAPARVKFEESLRLYTAKTYNMTWTDPEHTIANVRNAAYGVTALCHRVEIIKRSCTCGVWSQFGIPCSHAIRVL